jgi:hypothetical protein
MLAYVKKELQIGLPHTVATLVLAVCAGNISGDQLCGYVWPPTPCTPGGDSECEPCYQGQCGVWVKVLTLVNGYQPSETGVKIEAFYGKCQEDRRCIPQGGVHCGGEVDCIKTQLVVNTWYSTSYRELYPMQFCGPES